MAVLTHEAIMNAVNEYIGEAADDNALALLENLEDTLSDIEAKAADNTDWQAKYTELDETWRKRYRDRFENPVKGQPADPVEIIDEPGEPETKTKFEDLFEEKKED